MLGRLALTMTAISVVLAIVAASGASATVLCKEEGVAEACPAGKSVGSGTVLKAELTAGIPSVLHIGIGEVTCMNSKLEGKMTTAGGALGVPVKGGIIEATWTNCTCNGVAATMVPGNLAWSTEINGTGNKDGALTLLEPRLKIECEGLVCNYQKASITNLQFKGGNPAEIHAAIGQVFFERAPGSFFFCAMSAEWDAEYEVMAPKPVFVTKT
jgi:hypothetical protein